MSLPKFRPRVEELVSASPPHPPNTHYRVGIGPEDWDGRAADVEKVQMVYDGKVAGRKAPSYPVGSDDAERVNEALERLRKNGGRTIKKAGDQAPCRPTLVDLIGSAKGLYGTPDEVQAARDDLRREWP